MSIVEEEFYRYSKYVNLGLLKNKVFLITGAKGYLASATIRFLLYLNKKYKLNLFIYGTTRNATKIPEYIKKDDPIRYIDFDSFEYQTYDGQIDYLIHTANPTSRLEFIYHH